MSDQYWPSARDVDAKSSQLLDIKPSGSSTVFVRNLAWDVDDKQLGSYFDCGPVKRAFTLKDKNTDASKGVGFVEFAFTQDAQAAIEKYNGKLWMGRPIQVELALQQSSDPIQRKKLKETHLGEQKKAKELEQREQRKVYREQQRAIEQDKENEVAKTYQRKTDRSADNVSRFDPKVHNDKKTNNNNNKKQ